MVPTIERIGVLAPHTTWCADPNGSPELVMLAEALWRRLNGLRSPVSLSQNVSAKITPANPQDQNHPMSESVDIKVDSFRRAGDEIHLTGNITGSTGERFFVSLRIDRGITVMVLYITGPYLHPLREAALS